jgi:iron complex transport system ATP-binding protein
MKLAAHDLVVEMAGRVIVDAVSCVAMPGTITAVIGPNGAGKSTLLRALAGITSPAKGGVRLGDRPILDYPSLARGRALAYLPQDRAIHWPLQVRALVGLGRLPWRHAVAAGASRADHEAVDAAMAAMAVEHLQHRTADTLSGGERARVLLARALAQQAAVLVADEPTAGLDPAHQLTLFHRLQALAGEGRTIIVALHDLSLAARFAHHVVLLQHGRVACEGAGEAVLTPAVLEPVYGVHIRCGTLDGVPVVLPLAPMA